MGEVKNVLGMEITRRESTLLMKETSLIDKKCTKFSMGEHERSSTPMEKSFQIEARPQEVEVPCREAVGCVMCRGRTPPPPSLPLPPLSLSRASFLLARCSRQRALGIGNRKQNFFLYSNSTTFCFSSLRTLSNRNTWCLLPTSKQWVVHWQ